MEVKSREINIIVETLRRNNYRGTEIHSIITAAWGDVITVRRVQQIMKEYATDRRQDFDRELGSGGVKSQKRLDLVPLVRDELSENKRLTCNELAIMFDTNVRMIHHIITDDLDMKSVRDKWVPHELSVANKESRVQCCRNLIDVLSERNIRRYLIIVDEKWFYSKPIGCPQSRRSWTSVDEAGDRDTIPKRKSTDKKFMALVAINLEDLYFAQVLEPNQNVNSELYTNFLNDAVTSFSNHALIVQRRAVLWENMRLMHDNARPHTSEHTVRFLESKNVRRVFQAPYSPDLNMLDRLIFPMLEMKRSQINFQNANDLQHYLDETLVNLTPQMMRKEAEKLQEHCRKVIQAHGDYIS